MLLVFPSLPSDAYSEKKEERIQLWIRFCTLPSVSHTKVNREKFMAPKVLGAFVFSFLSFSDAIKSLFVAECR